MHYSYTTLLIFSTFQDNMSDQEATRFDNGIITTFSSFVTLTVEGCTFRNNAYIEVGSQVRGIVLSERIEK